MLLVITLNGGAFALPICRPYRRVLPMRVTMFGTMRVTMCVTTCSQRVAMCARRTPAKHLWRPTPSPLPQGGSRRLCSPPTGRPPYTYTYTYTYTSHMLHVHIACSHTCACACASAYIYIYIHTYTYAYAYAYAYTRVRAQAHVYVLAQLHLTSTDTYSFTQYTALRQAV